MIFLLQNVWVKWVKYVLGFQCCCFVGALGTFRTGFEEHSVGDRPSFVRAGLFGALPQISTSSTAPSYPPFEGDKFLTTSGEIRIASPDGSLITGFSLWFFAPTPVGRGGFSAGEYGPLPEDYGKWSRAGGTFATPISELSVQYLIFGPGQITTAQFAVDSLELLTIPEPSTALILAVFGSILLSSVWQAHRVRSPHEPS